MTFTKGFIPTQKSIKYIKNINWYQKEINQVQIVGE